MEQWFIVNADGFFEGHVVMSDNVPPLEEGQRIVTYPWPSWMYKPKHIEATDEWEDAEPPTPKTEEEILNEYKQNKIDVLTGLHDAELFGGFSYTNASGTTFYFGYDHKDQEYLHKKATMITLDPTITSVDWKTRDGFATFIRDEFISVIHAGDSHEESLVYKLMYLEANVMNSTTKTEVDSFNW